MRKGTQLDFENLVESITPKVPIPKISICLEVGVWLCSFTKLSQLSIKKGMKLEFENLTEPTLAKVGPL